MKHIDLFSGIGGFALAVDTVFGKSEHLFCDYDKFCQQVIKKHWPTSKIYGDIKTFTNTGSAEQRGISNDEWQKVSSFGCSDILTGGFPCQPFSHAGRRKGTEDNRYLWPQMLRVIQEFKPKWVIAENVRGLLTWNDGLVLEKVCIDLESEGYEVQPIIVPACAVDAPHRRDRVWFVAHAINDRPRDQVRESDESSGRIPQKYRPQDSTTGKFKRADSNWGIDSYDWQKEWPEVAAELCGMDDGLPSKLDGFELSKSKHRADRLKALGNSIVPQVAIQIIKSLNIN